jgi:glycosyltransferase involved in cell wall biosynthesis
MLHKLLSHLDRSTFDAHVISMIEIGPVGKKIQALGIPVMTLGMRRGVPNPFGLLRLARWLRQHQPDLVQTWGYHADLLGGLAVKLVKSRPVIWSIRNSKFDSRGSKRTTLWTIETCARFSRLLPTRIVSNSEEAGQAHAQLGYAAEKIVVIPNGFDVAAFKPDPAARRAVRRELGLPDGVPLIGLVARFDPYKDHHNFIQAAGHLRARWPEAHFLLCGLDVNWENRRLVSWINAARNRDRFHLLGLRRDIPRLTAALDIATVSSFSEAFPNVIGEAMACGVPCAVTDVGDSAMIVGDTGRVVPARDPSALAKAWSELLEAGLETRSQLGTAARRRIEEHFSLPAIVDRFEALYKELLHHVRDQWVY